MLQAQCWPEKSGRIHDGRDFIETPHIGTAAYEECL